MDMYGQVANAYGQELQNGVRLQAGLDQQAAQQPNTLFDRFMTAYQQKYLQRKAEAEMARKQQHEDTYMKMAQSADNSRVAETQNKWRDDVYNQWDGTEEHAKLLQDAGRRVGVANPEQYFDTSTKLEWNGAPMAPDSTLTKKERGGGGYLLKKKAAELNEKKLEQAKSIAEQGLEARLKMAEDARIAAAERDAASFDRKLAILAASRGGGGMTAGEYRQAKLEDDRAEKRTKGEENTRMAIAKNEGILANLEQTQKYAQELMNDPGLEKITGVLGSIEKTDLHPAARRARATYKTLIAKNVIGLIAEMKAMSRTGATGWGAISAPELEHLERAAGAIQLTQDAGDVKIRLKELNDRIEDVKQRVRAAGGNPGAPAPAGGGVPSELSGAPQSVIDAYNSGSEVTTPDGRKIRKGAR